ncbi:26S proteasome regulatory subunit 4 [Lemmus lemmus]
MLTQAETGPPSKPLLLQASPSYSAPRLNPKPENEALNLEGRMPVPSHHHLCLLLLLTLQEHYVSILLFVDKDLLEPGCSVLLNHKVHAVIGVLMDDTDPLVTVMKVEKAPQETYADIGDLDNQIQEIKESVELPLTHPE